MRGILEYVIVSGLFPSDDVFNLSTNLDHRVAEPTRHYKTRQQFVVGKDNLSSSSNVSDSVGSINIQVVMGHEQVGG